MYPQAKRGSLDKHNGALHSLFVYFKLVLHLHFTNDIFMLFALWLFYHMAAALAICIAHEACGFEKQELKWRKENEEILHM